MKQYGISITSRENAELVPVSEPEELNPNEIRGRTICTLISPGTELSCNYTADAFPSFPGYSAVFSVEETGSEVEGVSEGELFFCMGPHRSFQQVDVDSALRVPGSLPPEKAVLARLMGVSMTTLMTTSARPGDRVMVTGAGPVGFLAAQVFSASGYRVTVAEPDVTRRRYVEESAAAGVCDRVPVDDSGLAGTVALVAECSGHEQAVLDGCRVLRRRGEVVLIGVPWQRRTQAYAHELLSLVFHRYAVLRSGWEWELPHHASDFRPHSIYSNFKTAMDWLASGRVKVKDELILSAGPDKAQTAYQDLLNRRSAKLFTAFDWTSLRT